MCYEVDEGQCLDRSCCSVGDFDESNDTRSLCEEFGDSAACCKKGSFLQLEDRFGTPLPRKLQP